MTLIEFLLARIADDEYDAKVRSLGRGWRKQWLAECEAKRRIVELHGVDDDGTCQTCSEGGPAYDNGALRSPCPTLLLLALPYADHPDFQEEWKP